MQRRLHEHVLLLTALVATCGHTAPAMGQDEPDSKRPSPRFKIGAVGQHVLDTDLDGDGEFNISRFGTRFVSDIDLSPEVTLSLRATYELSVFDFSGVSNLGAADPWDDIHFLTLDGNVQWSLSKDWIAYGGPILRFAREGGAPLEDSVTAGAYFGATHIYSPDLIIGGGFGFMSEIEDDIRVFPIITLNWKINDTLRLVSTSGLPNIGGTGVELVWRPWEHWSLAAGAHYEYRRFRLDDSGTAPDGVGEETGLPIWGRVTYEVNESITLDLYLGLLTLEQLRLHDSNGSLIGEADADPGTMIALVGRVTF